MKEKKIIFQFDEQGNTSYIHLKEAINNLKPGESKKQLIYDGYDSEEVKKFGIELIIDIDKSGKIIGIEIIGEDRIPDSLKN